MQANCIKLIDCSKNVLCTAWKSVRIRSCSGLRFRIRTEYGEIRISPYSVQMRENADQNNHYGNVQSSKNLMRQSKEIGQYQNILISASAQFLAAMKSFISGMETGESRNTSCIALFVPKQNYIKMWCSIVFVHIFWKYMSIIGDYYNHSKYIWD